MSTRLTFYTDCLNYINAVCESYVAENVSAVARVIGPFAFTMLTLYVVLWGFAHYRGLIQEPLNDFVGRILIIAAVFGLGFNLANYNLIITNTFLHGPDEFVAGLARSPGAPGVMRGLDGILQQGFGIGARFWAKAGLLHGDFGMYIVALLVWILTLLVTAYGFFLIALSKVALTVIICLGPLFFLGLLFQATAGFFNAWLRQMANYFLIPLLVVMVHLLIMTLFSRAADAAISVTEVSQAFPFFAMGFVTLLALASVLSIASGLAGGVSLSSFGMGRLTSGLLVNHSLKAGKQLAKQSTRVGRKIARGAWGAYQGRQRNSIQPA